MKRKISFVLSIVLALSVFAGCGKKEESVQLNEADLQVNFGDYKDSEDIPSWSGKKLNLTVWVDANAVEAYQRYKKGDSDVVTPEFERITGVTYDGDNSFDNAGESFDAKIAQVIASGDYPAMAYSIPELSDLVKANKLYDLREYVEKYCPNIMRLFGPDTIFGYIWDEQQENYGGLYAIPTGVNASSIREMVSKDGAYEGLTEEQITRICGVPETPHGFFWVRDDILKMIYPEAHSYDELKAIVEERGSFTEEEIFDVPINTVDDFKDFLYKVDALDIPDDGMGKTYTMFTHWGKDNWMSCTNALPLFGYSGDCMDYYDIESKQLKYTLREPWFKDILKFYNKLIRDGVASSEALIDTYQIFQEKYNNGRYLVSIETSAPANNETNKYKYRKVWVKYTNNYDKILKNAAPHDGLMKISFFKEGIAEEDLIQALRAVDFALSEPGQKLSQWGPKSAGLYTEDENGNLQFVDEKLKLQAFDHNSNGNDLLEKYGLEVGPWPGRPRTQCNRYMAQAFYESPRTVSNQFHAGRVDPIYYPAYGLSDFYATEYTAILEGAKTFWQSRNAFEEALTRVFASESDEQFEERYQAVVDLQIRNGLTEETLAEYQKAFEEKNKIYEGNIEAYLEANKDRKQIK